MSINKAIAGLATPVIVSLLLPLGITDATPVGEALPIVITAVVTSLAVYLIPNKK